MECLITNKVCPNTNKKCKECILDECKGALRMLEIQEKNYRIEKLNELKKHLPKECKNCSMLQVIDLNNKKVNCFYRMKDKCILKRKIGDY